MGRILSRNEDRGESNLDDEEDQGLDVQVVQPPGEHDYGPGPSGVEPVNFNVVNQVCVKITYNLLILRLTMLRLFLKNL